MKKLLQLMQIVQGFRVIRIKMLEVQELLGLLAF